MIIKINGQEVSSECPVSRVSYFTNEIDTKSINTSKAVLKRFSALGTKALFALVLSAVFVDIFTTAGTASAAVATTANVATHGTSLASAFAPVKELLLDIADPLCYVMFVWGCIECICGRPASGLNRMKYAAIGYIAINWIPVVMAAIRAAGP